MPDERPHVHGRIISQASATCPTCGTLISQARLVRHLGDGRRRRRLQLVEKLIDSGLSDHEADELERLQAEAGREQGGVR